MNKTNYIFLFLLLCFPLIVWSQADQMIVSGKVCSKADGGELPGVNVLEVDGNNRTISATTTDFSGNFSFQIKKPSNSIRFTYVGFKAVTMPIGSKRTFDVKLEESAQLAEVVVQAKPMHSDGTITIPEREISGAVQKINAKAFEGLSVATIDDALQGRIAGLDIVENSGDLGAGSSMRIRGITSITANSTPLIVLNDVPYENNISSSFDYANANQEDFANLLNINPNDIEEIVVLKDGASAAIWGSKGANGVISIKTKRGVKGPLRLQYLYRLSGKMQPQGLKMLNGNDYTMLMKQEYFNPNQNENDANVPEFNYDPTFSEYQNFNNNTDWVKAVTQYGIAHDHNLSITGGGDKARFRTSLGYYQESGTVIDQNLKRISGNSNVDYIVSSRIKFTSDFLFTYTNNDMNYQIPGSSDDNQQGLLHIAYKKMPNVSIYRKDMNGNDTGEFYTILQNSSLNPSQRDLYNPVALAKLATNNSKNIEAIPSLRLQYDILDPDASRLTYNGLVSFDIESQKQTRFLPSQLSSKGWLDPSVNDGYYNESEGLTMTTEHSITWTPKLENQSLILYGGFQLTSGNSQFLEFENYGLPGGSITSPTTPGSDATFNSGQGQWRSMAFTGRMHYALRERYILDATFRREGSTRFGYNRRWGNFPGVSGKWIISDEPFMKPAASWLNELGIRAGWGVTGNQPDKEYLYFSRYNGDWGTNSSGIPNSGSYINIPTIKPSSFKLSDLRWEKNSSYNLGFDLQLFDNKYLIDANVYYRRTDDLLFPNISIPTSSGFSSLAYINAGSMGNQGWEFNFSTNNMIKAGSCTFDINFNLSNYTNKIITLSPSILNAYNKDFNYQNGKDSYLTRIQAENSFGSIYGFKYLGVYQYDKYVPGRKGTCPVATDANGNVILDSKGNPIPMTFAYGMFGNNAAFRGGDAMYEDVNHDGTIDELDIVYLGNCNPKLNGGFGATFKYKNFSVNAFFTFRYGNKIINAARMNAESMYTNDNQSVATNWRWRQDGDITQIPRALYQAGYNFLGSDRYVEDGSFLRFKYLTFNYGFDQKLIKSLLLSQLNLYLTLNNIITFTKYTGVDPEISPSNLTQDIGLVIDNNTTPRPQYFTLGVTIGF